MKLKQFLKELVYAMGKPRPLPIGHLMGMQTNTSDFNAKVMDTNPDCITGQQLQEFLRQADSDVVLSVERVDGDFPITVHGGNIVKFINPS